jgi:hypothetical protein
MTETTIARRFEAGSTVGHTIDLPVAFPLSGALMRPAEFSPTVRKTVPMALELVRRVTPWCSVTLTPRLYVRQFCVSGPDVSDPLGVIDYSGEPWEAALGLACPRLNAIYLALRTSPRELLLTAAHECWHMLESRLAPWMIDLVDSALDASVATQYWDNEYYRWPQEIRARAFEAWCARLLAGLPAPTYVRRTDEAETIDEIFGMAWSGQLAAELDAEQKEAA